MRAIQGFDGQAQNEVRRVPGLEHEENVFGLNRRHESAQKLLPGQRRVGDGRTVGVDGRAAAGQEVALDRLLSRERAIDTDTRLHGVTGDDRRHVHEHRQVHVAELDDVEERLLLPRVRDGRAVVETVHGNGPGAEMSAAGEHHCRRKGEAGGSAEPKELGFYFHGEFDLELGLIISTTRKR